MKLVSEDDPILRTRTPIFDFENPSIDPKTLFGEMLECMVVEHGMGLAAPQVGLPLRVFVMRDTEGRNLFCANPEVISTSDDCDRIEEGCLSFPNLMLKVKRPISVEARYQNEFGNLVYETFENLNARCYLHEADHLNGVRFTDLVGPLTLKSGIAKRKKREASSNLGGIILRV